MSLDDDTAVDLLREMVATPSLCGGEDAVAEVILRSMREAGFQAHRDSVGNVIGTTGGEGPEVVILGHMDTVPGQIPVEIREGSLYGRGSVDAKGPLATGIVAAARAAQVARARLTVIGAVQEEGPSVGARHLLDRPAPAYLVIAEPSSWESVVLGYKGSQRFTVRLSQANGHTAGPELSAPERMVAFWNDLGTYCAAHSPDRPAAERPDGFNDLTPTLIAMGSSNDGLEDAASMHIGLRLPPGVSLTDLRAGVQALLPAAQFTFAPGEEAVRGGKSNRLVGAFLRAIRAQGGTPRFKVKTGTADMNVVRPVWRCPMVAYGPGDSKLDHTPHEHVPIRDYLHAVRVLTAVLEDL